MHSPRRGGAPVEPDGTLADGLPSGPAEAPRHLGCTHTKAYQNLEMDDQFHQLEQDPHGCPYRRADDCLLDLVACWEDEALHLAALKGWKANMIVNALDGSEDHLASQEMAQFWAETNMDTVRKGIVNEMTHEFEAGRLQWAFECVYGWVLPHAATGYMDVYEEGQEDEGQDDDVNRAPWNDCRGASPNGSDEEIEGNLVPMSEVQQKETADHLARLADLDKASQGVGAKEPAVAKAIASVRAQVLRAASGRCQCDAVVAQAVRQGQKRQQARLEQERRRAHHRRTQLDADKKARERADERAMASIRRAANTVADDRRKIIEQKNKLRETQARNERRDALHRAKHAYTLAELGQGHAKGGTAEHKKRRMDILRRVARLGDDLPDAEAADFTRWVKRLDDQMQFQHQGAWPLRFQVEMNRIINAIKEGNNRAFVSYHAKMTRDHLGEPSLVIPAVAGAPAAIADG